jgi:hypothetical protein
MHFFRNTVSLRKVHLTHTQGRNEPTHNRPQTERFYSECKSTDPSLVTWRSAVYEPPEDGFMRDRNMLGQILSVLIRDFSIFKVYKVCIGSNNKKVIKTL